MWASLAHNHLSIMALSMSCEQTFLSAGITISKCHNWLKPDIIKVLQYLKSMIHHGLLFHKSPLSFVEQKLYSKDLVADGTCGDLGSADVVGEGVSTWDELIEDDADDDSRAPGDDLNSNDDVFVPSIK